MSRLTWIGDSHLEQEIAWLLSSAKDAQKKALQTFGKNVIDPFAAVFEMSGFGMDYEAWIKSETSRQIQKTLQNNIGSFHQNILGYAPDWTNQKTGNIIDLKSDKNKIIAEVKNKFNTISGGQLSRVYYSLEGLVSPKASIYKGYTAYYVEIISRKPGRYNIPFCPSDKDRGERCPENEKIRKIDGASFYSLVTGQDNAIECLFDVILDVIFDCPKGKCEIKDKNKLKDFFNLAYGAGQ